MVCPRCVATVRDVFSDVDVAVDSIQLGEVVLRSELPTDKKARLKEALLANGFEFLQDHNSQIISQIKTLVIQQIHHNKDALKVNFSSYLAKELGVEYTSLSRLFSTIEGVTIEKFILKQKIEKVKELMFYDEMTLSEISFDMGYSSVAHLSSQFKKETGMSPSAFKKLNQSDRNSLDSI